MGIRIFISIQGLYFEIPVLERIFPGHQSKFFFNKKYICITRFYLIAIFTCMSFQIKICYFNPLPIELEFRIHI